MTDWEDHYRQGATPWDKGAPAPPLVDFLQTETMEGSVFVPGCGLGHDVRAIAAASPAARILGLDLAPSAVARARELPAAGAEAYLEGDLFALPSELAGTFDWVWEHTCFCAIDPGMRADYVSAVSAVLKPGGRLLGVFYLDPYDDEHRPEDGRPPFGTSFEELERRFEGRLTVVRSWVPERAFPGRAGRERMVMAEKS
jgi:SAM-dependent methyltransferase